MWRDGQTGASGNSTYPNAVSANLLYGFGHVPLHTAATNGLVVRAVHGAARRSGDSGACATRCGPAPASTTPTAWWAYRRLVGAHGPRRRGSVAVGAPTHTARSPR